MGSRPSKHKPKEQNRSTSPRKKRIQGGTEVPPPLWPCSRIHLGALGCLQGLTQPRAAHWGSQSWTLPQLQNRRCLWLGLQGPAKVLWPCETHQGKVQNHLVRPPVSILPGPLVMDRSQGLEETWMRAETDSSPSGTQARTAQPPPGPHHTGPPPAPQSPAIRGSSCPTYHGGDAGNMQGANI